MSQRQGLEKDLTGMLRQLASWETLDHYFLEFVLLDALLRV